MTLKLDPSEEERLYHAISSAASRAAGRKFTRLWVRTEADVGVSSTGLYFQADDGTNYFVTVGLETLDAAMVRLWEALSSAGAPPFSIAVFELEASGRFRIEFSYEALGGMVGDWERAQVWERNRFGPSAEFKYIE